LAHDSLRSIAQAGQFVGMPTHQSHAPLSLYLSLYLSIYLAIYLSIC
jgi:hypothetical protein